MNESKIIEAVLNVYEECQIQSFPIDCLHILEHYQYKTFTYKKLKSINPELYEMCMAYSEDAFQDHSSMIIAYNQAKPESRIRFSLMHELGHHVFGHQGTSDLQEREANAFASQILAPRMAIHYARCRNAGDVAQCFSLSYEAASVAYTDYQR